MNTILTRERDGVRTRHEVESAIDASNIEGISEDPTGETCFAETYNGNVYELVGGLEENIHLLRNVPSPLDGNYLKTDED